MIPLFLVLIAIVSYLLGNLNGAILSSKYIYKKDIRQYGSGNAGLTNFYRIFGITGILLVVAVDVGKSVIAILIGGWLMGFQGFPIIGKLFAGFCLMLGHTYPAMYQFKGGKGVLCVGILALMVDWRIGLVCWAVFIAIAAVTRFVSLGSMIGVLFLPVGLWVMKFGALEGTLGLFCALLLIFKHRENIGRLIAGKETKFTFKSAKPKPANQESHQDQQT